MRISRLIMSDVQILAPAGWVAVHALRNVGAACRHSLRGALVVPLLLAGLAAAAGEDGAAQAPGEELRDRFADLTLAGVVAARVDGVVRTWLMVAPDRNPAMLGMFADRDRTPYRDLLPWSGEFAGKYLTACVETIALTHDAALAAKVRDFVPRLIALQDADGYLGPYPKGSRLTGQAPNCANNWDAWSHYHIMLGMLLWHARTQDAAALRCAERIGDLLCAHFLGSGHHVADMGSPDQNQAVIHGLCLLYEATRTPRYRELAEQIVGEFSLPGAGDYLRTALAGQEFFATPKPRWESLHAILGLAELYRITGRTEYRSAFEHIWWSIAKLDRHDNGGFSTGEQAVGNPYARGAIETCCTVAWIAASVDMLRLTDDPVVADELELSTLNSILGLHSPDGSWTTYNTPMDGRRVPNTTEIAFQIRPGAEGLNCCSVNAARGLGMISEWAASGPGDAAPTVTLNWYGPASITMRPRGVPVTLTTESRYPRDGRIAVRIAPRERVGFTLRLRVPAWSTATRITVNGTAVAVHPGTYCAIEREWSAGDEVAVELDMRLRAWVGERECAGTACLFRGPLLLAHEPGAGPGGKGEGNWERFGDSLAGQMPGSAYEADFTGSGVVWVGKRYDDAGITRVLIDGREVARVDQYDAERGKPFSWEARGLPPGAHHLRLEVTGQRSPASKGTWSNIDGLGGAGDARPRPAAAALPRLDLDQLRPQIREPDGTAPAPLALVEVQDISGHPMLLRDFASAGAGGVAYVSWLAITGGKPVEFSRTNPQRTVNVEK
jgi:DUF1680 family protein